MTMRTRSRHLTISSGILLMVLLSTNAGCKPDTFSLDRGVSLTTEANTRLMLNTAPSAIPRPGLVQPQRIVCVEPSPDVAVSITEVFKASLELNDDRGGGIESSEVQNVLQLAERTATLQLLREQMYRACEAYANGAISGTTYSLITSKNNKTMVSLLLGESVTPRPTRQSSESATAHSEILEKSRPESRRYAGGTQLPISGASILKEMQKQFLDDDYLDELVSTCLVELGLNTEQRHYLDPINVAFRTVHEQYLNSMDNFRAKQNEHVSNQLETALIRMNDTYLSRLCKEELPKILRHHEKKEVLSGRESTLEEFNQAMERCSSLSEDSGINDQCILSVISIAAIPATGNRQQEYSELSESLQEQRVQLRRNLVELEILQFRGEATRSRVFKAKQCRAGLLRDHDKYEMDFIEREFSRKLTLAQEQVSEELKDMPAHRFRPLAVEDDLQELQRHLTREQEVNRRHRNVVNEMETAIRLGELYVGGVDQLLNVINRSSNLRMERECSSVDK